jgi:peptidoglycan pentaglycine glycine transferase (the first glycine)
MDEREPLPDVSPDAAASTGLRVSSGLPDRAWDAFVQRSPGGHYKQSAAWARFKAGAGWRAQRIHVRDGARTVAGVQLLTRPVPVLGAIGHVARGPIADDVDALDVLLDEMDRICRAQRIQYLAVTPAEAGSTVEQHLRVHGLHHSERLSGIAATGRVDLGPDTDELLRRMRRSTRANVRRAQRRGLTAREGSERDLDTFFELLALATQRKRFTTFADDRVRDMWRALRADDHARIFLVEADGEPVSAQLAIAYGDTLYSHLMAWSGRHGDRKPNELLDWTALTWAKDRGYRYYDFEGIVADDERRPAKDPHVSDYKRGFGLEVVAMPATYERLTNPALRWCRTSALPRIEGTAAYGVARKRVLQVVSGRRQGPRSSG